ncbi:hypothetical protein BCR33DRAFT_775545 [Rhizoclosmatium globosum]|uniref:UspA domain-containing protein n=1 Tax=Rhizoclosmatium globosum TaxID=329046 RepID=A0A1Y2AK80_9FUNG|nr:hypothetical protein BCR33DRAFT_775545 [Rhizoclosmatium globosum]|eukprot:ORY22914.1 hypothetical protein BCR33DRAFT_775545 [Rhizoclosmatium globosum]
MTRTVCIALSETAPAISGIHWAFDNVCQNGDNVVVVMAIKSEADRAKHTQETKDLVCFLANQSANIKYKVEVVVASSSAGAAIVDFVAGLKPDTLVVTPFSKLAADIAKKDAEFCRENASCAVVVAPVGATEEASAESFLTKAALKGMLFKPKVNWF